MARITKVGGMEWRDEGILLQVRSHGESSAIIDMFTPTQGRHAGVVRGGASRKMSPILQPGAQLDVHWRARLDAHIGAFQAELVRSRSALVMSDRRALAGLNSVTALLLFTLPERAPHLRLYTQTEAILDLLDQPEIWPLAYLQWELCLLEELGFGLELGSCAVTGGTEGLEFVSPRTGRAVSREGAGQWADRLLPLPPVLRREGDAPDDEILQALGTTGFFLESHLAPALGDRPIPDARARLIRTLERRP